MLSGDGNENGEKTTIGLINKKQLFTCSTLYCTFLCPCFARLQRETYVFSLTFFFSAVHLRLSGRQHFLFSHRRYKFFMLVVLPLLCFFISRSSSLSLFFWLSFSGLSLLSLFSVFLFLYIPNLWT